MDLLNFIGDYFMKIERLSSKKTCEFWEFIKANLPSSLRAVKRVYGYGLRTVKRVYGYGEDGYGEIWGIEVKEKSDLFGYLPLTDGIATVMNDTLELRHPEYFSDFEDLCRQYEVQTSKEITFRYWVS